jgi:hypothetical protein
MQESCSLAEWERAVSGALGPDYCRLSSVSLRAICLGLWARRRLRGRVLRLRASSVATGLGNMYGNKVGRGWAGAERGSGGGGFALSSHPGGAALSLCLFCEPSLPKHHQPLVSALNPAWLATLTPQGGVALSLQLGSGLRLLFVGAHFAAHGGRVARRNADFHAIRAGLFRGGAALAASLGKPPPGLGLEHKAGAPDGGGDSGARRSDSLAAAALGSASGEGKSGEDAGSWHVAAGEEAGAAAAAGGGQQQQRGMFRVGSGLMLAPGTPTAGAMSSPGARLPPASPCGASGAGLGGGTGAPGPRAAWGSDAEAGGPRGQPGGSYSMGDHAAAEAPNSAGADAHPPPSGCWWGRGGGSRSRGPGGCVWRCGRGRVAPLVLPLETADDTSLDPSSGSGGACGGGALEVAPRAASCPPDALRPGEEALLGGGQHAAGWPGPGELAPSDGGAGAAGTPLGSAGAGAGAAASGSPRLGGAERPAWPGRRGASVPGSPLRRAAASAGSLAGSGSVSDGGGSSGGSVHGQGSLLSFSRGGSPGPPGPDATELHDAVFWMGVGGQGAVVRGLPGRTRWGLSACRRASQA